MEVQFLRTASASGLTPFSIMEMQMDRVRRSRWQFYRKKINFPLTLLSEFFSGSLESEIYHYTAAHAHTKEATVPPPLPPGGGGG